MWKGWMREKALEAKEKREIISNREAKGEVRGNRTMCKRKKEKKKKRIKVKT